MHLLMLGVQKTMMNKVKYWHIMRGSQTSFYEYTDGILDSIQELNLSWCKTVPYKKAKMGGWISESYMAMARLNKWFYSGVNSISYDKAVKELDILPRSSWLKEHNTAWLTLRNIDTSGNADDLKKRVKYNCNLPEGPPEPSEI